MKYIVSIARIEHQVYRIEVDAESESDAEDIAMDEFSDGDIDWDKYEVVHAEEFVNQVDKMEATHV